MCSDVLWPVVKRRHSSKGIAVQPGALQRREVQDGALMAMKGSAVLGSEGQSSAVLCCVVHRREQVGVAKSRRVIECILEQS